MMSDRLGERIYLASFLRTRWNEGTAARLSLTELPGCGGVLLSLETRGVGEGWTRRVQLQVDPELIAPVAEELGIELRSRTEDSSDLVSTSDGPPPRAPVTRGTPASLGPIHFRPPWPPV